MLRIYNIEKHSAVLENAPGFMRLDVHIYGPVTKWQHWGMLINWGSKRAFPKCCTSRNATGAEFLEVQIPLRVLVYDWVL